MVVFEDQSILWSGYSNDFNIVTDTHTCVRPGDGGNGGQSNYEENPSIYNEDGSVKPASNVTELITMFAECETVA